MRTSIAALLAALLFLLAACTLPSSRLEQAAMPMPGGFAEESVHGRPAPAFAPWWQLFADPVLDALLAEALVGNQDLARARARVAQLAALAEGNRARLFPTLALGGRAVREQSLGQAGEGIAEAMTLSVAAGYEVDLWDRLGSQARAAALGSRAAGEDLRFLRLSLAAQVADLYFLAVEKRAQLQLADESIATLAEVLDRVESRYQSGLASAADVYQARQNLLEVRESRPTFAAALSVAEHGLAILLGRFPQTELSGTLAVLPEAPEALPACLPASLLHNRPDIEAAFLRLAASDAEMAAAIADRLPAINLMAGYGLSRLDLPGVSLSGIIWNLLAEFSQPLFDAGRRRSEVVRRQALFDEGLAAYRQTVLQAVREVEDALANNRATEERLTLLLARNEASSAGLRLAEQDYFAGLSDYLPVLIARQLHYRDQSSLLAARRQLLADRISLARSLGGAWAGQAPPDVSP